jgi:hypothetical protein
MTVAVAYGLGLLATLVAFRRLHARSALLVVFLGGWLLLPVAVYPPAASDGAFPYWIVGLALPSDLLVNKAWLVPVFAALGVLVFDWPTVRAWRPGWMDFPIALWCLWPVSQAVFIDAPQPDPLVSSAYLVATWGLTWLLGRIYFSTTAARWLLARAVAWAGIACLPFAIVEGLFGSSFYAWVYGVHPFRDDGAVRYVGFRPLGFFEHGNQYGVWVAAAALSAVWIAIAFRAAGGRNLWMVIAATAVAISFAAQSIGATLLLGAALLLLLGARTVSIRGVVVASVTLLGLGSAVYVSGVVPVVKIAKETTIGRSIVDAVKQTGRGSFTWRISQDQKLLSDATQRPLVGQGKWDWWRDRQTRPWGLTMLVLGQFGGIGLGLFLAVFLLPLIAALWRRRTASVWAPESVAVPLALIVGIALMDALLNAFLFFPALLLAGSISASQTTVTPTEVAP